MKDEEKNELMTVPEYEMIDQVDDKSIVEMMTGQAIEDYVYSFRQGGRQVEGLTLAGINEAANRRGGIQVEDINFEEKEHSWIAIVKAVDTFTGSARYGASEQPKKIGGKDDPFAFTKAIHKAQRNAIKQLIPTPVIKEVLSFYLNRKRGVETAPISAASTATTSTPQQIEAPQEADAQEKITNAQKSAFAFASRLKERMLKENLSQTDYWNYVRRKFHVESRNDMTEEQWTQLAAELKAADESQVLFRQLIEQIKKVDAAQKSSEIPAQEAETEEKEERKEKVAKVPQSAKAKETLF